jgi:aldose 1-epimerase
VRLYLTLTILACACGACSAPARKSEPQPPKEDEKIYILTNANGVEVRTIPYGAIITSIKVPDRSGRLDDVVLGFDTPDDYVAKTHPYFGAIVGRYGNRIAKGQFTLDGTTYKLATNNGPNHLHGGVKGFDKVVWQAEPFEREGARGIAYTYVSADGEEGYPGTVTARVSYTLTPSNELVVGYDATTTKATPLNLTQHTYFNLAGDGSGDILGHLMTIDADRFTPVDATLIPTGELAPVEGTPFDFRKPAAVGARIANDHPQLKTSQQPSRACSSMRAIFSTARSPASRDTCTSGATGCVWRRSTIPTRRTMQIFRPRFFAPANAISRRPSLPSV